MSKLVLNISITCLSVFCYIAVDLALAHLSLLFYIGSHPLCCYFFCPTSSSFSLSLTISCVGVHSHFRIIMDNNISNIGHTDPPVPTIFMTSLGELEDFAVHALSPSYIALPTCHPISSIVKNCATTLIMWKGLPLSQIFCYPSKIVHI